MRAVVLAAAAFVGYLLRTGAQPTGPRADAAAPPGGSARRTG